MLLSEYMGKVLAAEATGEYNGRDMVLAVDCTEDGSAESPSAYTYAGAHIENYGATLNPKTEDKSYVYEGDSTLKLSTQRVFSVTGQRLISDAFQDFICSHAVAFGKGSQVQRPYVYFHSGTKKGEQGICTIIVNNDGNGAASSPADIDVELRCHSTKEYTYSGT